MHEVAIILWKWTIAYPYYPIVLAAGNTVLGTTEGPRLLLAAELGLMRMFIICCLTFSKYQPRGSGYSWSMHVRH